MGAVMKVMPEKEPSIRKKIAKLEERKRAQAATPVGASALKGTHRTRTSIHILATFTYVHTTHSTPGCYYYNSFLSP